MEHLELIAFTVVIGLLFWRVRELEGRLLSERKIESGVLERLLTLSVTQASGRAPQEAAAVTSLLEDARKETPFPTIDSSKKSKFESEYEVLYDPTGVIKQ